MEQRTISQNQLINQILRIGHADLSTYTAIGLRAAKEEPWLLAHLIAWNNIKGEVRDSKMALPILALRADYDEELTENAVAHLVSLDPRSLVQAIRFNKSLRLPVSRGAGALLKRAIYSYLKVREGNSGWWARTVLQHRASIKSLYALFHIKPTGIVQDVIFEEKKPKGSVFEAVAQLNNMAPQEAAGTILNYKIPFLVAIGAVGGIKNKPDIILALLEQASGSEIINNTATFKRLGIFDSPALKAAYDAGIQRAKEDKKVGTLKAGKAAAVIKATGDQKIAQKLEAVQTEKLEKLGGIEGDWLVLGDCSGSMELSIERAKEVAALITQQVKGQVYLVFFNTKPYRFNVTGLSLAQIKDLTRYIRASGGTSIGCGLELLRFNNIEVNGIVIISDGGENSDPLFANAYEAYTKSTGLEPTVYHLWLPGELNIFHDYCRVQVQEYDISRMDYYSLPNLIKTLRSNRYSLAEEILATPLLRLTDALHRKHP